MEVNYKNPELKAYFEKHIGKMRVDPEYKPYLVDIMLRRSYEYSSTPEEIDRDLKALMRLKKIEVKKNISNRENLMGCYKPRDNKIQINKDWINKRLVDSYLAHEVLTHEVYHALTHDKHGIDRLNGINSMTYNPNLNIFETIIEKSAYRTVLSQSIPSIYYNLQSRGYSDVTFVLDMLEGAYGVSEKDFLQHSIRDRGEMKEFLSTQANEPPKETSKFIDGLEANFALLFNMEYSKLPNKTITFDERDSNIANSVAGMSNLCIRKIRSLMERKQITSIEDAQELLEQSKFSYNKIVAIVEKKLYDYDNTIKSNTIAPEIERKTKMANLVTADRICDMQLILENRDRFASESDAIDAFNKAKNGTLFEREEDKEALKKIGIYKIDTLGSKFGSKFELSPETVEKESRKNEEFTKWGYSSMPGDLKELFVSKATTSISERLENLIKSIKARVKKQKVIAEPQPLSVNPKETLTNDVATDTIDIFKPLSKEEIDRNNQNVRLATNQSSKNAMQEDKSHKEGKDDMEIE